MREGGKVLGSAEAQRSPPVGQPRRGPTGEDSSDVHWRMGGKGYPVGQHERGHGSGGACRRLEPPV